MLRLERDATAALQPLYCARQVVLRLTATPANYAASSCRALEACTSCAWVARWEPKQVSCAPPGSLGGVKHASSVQLNDQARPRAVAAMLIYQTYQSCPPAFFPRQCAVWAGAQACQR